MEQRLINGTQARYIAAEYDGENRSGRTPFGKNVIIKCDKCASETAGGIMYTQDMVDRMTQAAETGVLIAIGSDAFKRHDDGTLWRDEDGKPKVGQRIDFHRYSGVVVTGADGELYRVMGHECIVAGVIEGTLVTVDPNTLDPEGVS